MAAELDAEILDRGSLQRFERHHHELIGGLGLELRELVGQRRPRLRVENIGLVHHPTAERGEVERERGKNKKERDEGEKRETPMPTLDRTAPLPGPPAPQAGLARLAQRKPRPGQARGA